MSALTSFYVSQSITCTFLQNDRLPDGTVSGKNAHGYTIRRVDRYDAGRYTCTADNGVGIPATAHINLQVLCKYICSKDDLLALCSRLHGWRRAAEIAMDNASSAQLGSLLSVSGLENKKEEKKRLSSVCAEGDSLTHSLVPSVFRLAFSCASFFRKLLQKRFLWRSSSKDDEGEKKISALRLREYFKRRPEIRFGKGLLGETFALLSQSLLNAHKLLSGEIECRKQPNSVSSSGVFSSSKWGLFLLLFIGVIIARRHHHQPAFPQ